MSFIYLFILRFKMNKFILLLLGLLFFPHILDQIGLLLDFFFLRPRYCQDDHILGLFQIRLKKNIFRFQRVQNFILRWSNKKNLENYI